MSQFSYQVSSVDTSLSAASERFPTWCEHVRNNHGGISLDHAGTAAFRGTTIVQRARDLQLVEFWSDAVRYTRAPSVTTDGDATMRVLLPRRGTFRVEAGDSQLDIDQRTGVMVSMAEPFAITHGRGARAWVFSMPAEKLPRAHDLRQPTLLHLSSGVGAVITALLQELSQQRQSLDEAEFLDAAEAAAHLLSRRAIDELGTGHAVARAALALAYEHSDDPDLTPSMLATRLGWSLRYVQLVTQTLGTTPSRMILDARLARAAARLRDPLWDDRGIAQIAHASGFRALSTFNATFHATFGRPPREARRRPDGDPRPAPH